MDTELQSLENQTINNISKKPISNEVERQQQQDGKYSERTLAAQMSGGPTRFDTLGSDCRPNDKKSDVQAPSPVEGNADQFEYITGIKLALTTSVISLASFTMLLDTAIIVTAVPKITSDFHSLGDVGWYGSAYLLTSAALQPLTGKIYEKFSSKFVYMSFLGVFELGSLLCGVAQSSKMFILGRAVAGLGGSGLMNGGLTIISACVPMEKRATYMGFMMSFGLLGTLFGPLIGGALTQYTTWRWCFYINLPIGAIVALSLFFVHIPDRRVKSAIESTSNIKSLFHSLDITGFFLFAPTIIMFLLALEWGGDEYPWSSAMVIGLFCGSAGLSAFFLGWEYRKGDEAMIPLPMIRQRVVWSAMVVVFFLFGSMLSQAYYLAIYFQAVKGASPTLSGVYVLPGMLSQILFATISGLGVSRLGYYLPWSIFGGIMNSIGTGLLSTLDPGTGTAAWVGYQIFGGIGRGCSLQMPLVAVQNTLPTDKHPVSLAVLIFAQTIGGSILLSIAEAVFNNGLHRSLERYAPDVTYEEVTVAGAREFRHILPASSVQGVIQAYNKAVNHVFYLGASVAALAFLFSWGLGWKKIQKEKKNGETATETEPMGKA